MSTERWILHVDLDQFIAAVELLRRPELRGKPVIVGGSGDPTQRTVVATATYEAREFGVHSGMPMRTAAKKCPDAVFLPADNAAYEEVSEHVMDALRSCSTERGPVVVEVIGWDEAFVGAETAEPESLAREIQRIVRETTDLSCAVGIGDNKVTAKIATGFGKPGGIFTLTATTWRSVMDDKPPDALWGIGSKTTKKLAELGITTVAQLAASDRDVLARRFGPRIGPWLRVLAHGFGESEVTGTPYVPKSRSRETTFQTNIASWDEVRVEIAKLAQQVTRDVAEEGRPAVRIGVKVRYAPFITQTRSIGLPAPTFEATEIERGALEALAKFEPDRPVRLLGVRAEFPPTD